MNIFSCPECLQPQKVAFHFLHLFLYSELLVLLTILPTSSTYSAYPPTGYYLCCTLAAHFSQTALWLRQGVHFDMPQEESLQGD
jgi:hypothetical protein